MSFKSLVQSLLDLFVKKSETEWIGNQALPSSSAYVEQNVSNNQTITAPYDGYATLFVDASDMLFTASTGNGQGTVGAIFPIKKGDSFGIWVSTNVQYDMRYFNKVGLC